MKQAILVVSFGTTFPETRDKNISAVVRRVAAQWPECPVYEAWTSSMIMRALEKRGEHVDNVPEALERMAADGVAIVKLFPGISEQMLRAMLSAEGLQGVVLETYGAGNAPTNDWFLQLMRQTVERGVTVLNVTQCDSGSVEMQLYETGQQLRAAGVISGYDITTEAAVTKLMYVMGKNLTPNYRHELMARPVKGEFTL